MRAPKYWQKERATESIGGKTYALARWGWSDAGEEQARQRAAERLAATIEALRRGDRRDLSYDYHADPLREQLLEVVGVRESARALITRNGYGARVLNTAHVFFADVDVPAGGGFLRFFRRRSPKDTAIARVEEWVSRNPWAGFRVYETPAGLRLLATDKVRDPESSESDALLEALDSDALYRRLCRAQRCYRARLTAKPWRIGLDRNPVRFPEERTRDEHERWCKRYDPAAADYAACRFLKQIGTDARSPEIEEIVTLHDTHSGARGPKPLA